MRTRHEATRGVGRSGTWSARFTAMLGLAVSLVAWALVGCGGAETVTVTQAPVAGPEIEARCTQFHMPIYFLFRCRDASFDPSFADNRIRLAGVLEYTRRPGVRRMFLRGAISRNGPEAELAGTDLAARRAQSVADALARAGVPRSFVEVHERAAELALASDEPDRCPPRAEDDGYPRRRVEVGTLVCER